MSDFVSGKTDGADASCAFFGEGVTFKGSITAPERIVVHGTVEGDLWLAICWSVRPAPSRAM
jgi:cytoskeletal protein CcmA (bactofilin family)